MKHNLQTQPSTGAEVLLNPKELTQSLMRMDVRRIVFCADQLSEAVVRQVESLRTSGHDVELHTSDWTESADKTVTGLYVGLVTAEVIAGLRTRLAGIKLEQVVVVTHGFGGCEADLAEALIEVGAGSVVLTSVVAEAPANISWIEG